ncbi:MAG: hypothetical protein AAGD10_07475 [Myxococcota bacterium]
MILEVALLGALLGGPAIAPVPKNPLKLTEPTAAGLAQGRAYTKMLYSGALDELHGKFNETLAGNVPGPLWSAQVRGFLQAAGPERELVQERAYRVDGRNAYFRLLRFENTRLYRIAWIVEDDGTIANFYMTEVSYPERRAMGLL